MEIITVFVICLKTKPDFTVKLWQIIPNDERSKQKIIKNKPQKYLLLRVFIAHESEVKLKKASLKRQFSEVAFLFSR